MADFRGLKRNDGINLIVKSYDNSIVKDKDGEVKVCFLDVEIDHRDTKFGKQTQPHLVNIPRVDEAGKPVLNDKGKQLYSNGAPYSKSQLDAIVATAGENTTPYITQDGKKVGDIYVVKAPIMRGSGPKGTDGKPTQIPIINTKALEVADYDCPETLLDDQFQARQAYRAEVEAKKQAEAPAKQAQPAAQSLEGMSVADLEAALAAKKAAEAQNQAEADEVSPTF